MTTHKALPLSRQFFLRRTIILGCSVFAAFVFAGIAMMLLREYEDSLLTMPTPVAYRLLIRATLGPTFMGFFFLWPVTLPVIFVLAMMFHVGSKFRRIWLSVLAFVLMGIYWLRLVKLLADGAFD